MRGKREEVNLVGVRMQAAAYRGRMKEAALLATEWQARMDAASRRQRTGEGICGLAINEALVGLVDQAKARVAAALDEELLLPSSLDERLVLAAILKDGELARELLPPAIAEFKKDNGTNPQAARGREGAAGAGRDGRGQTRRGDRAARAHHVRRLVFGSGR